MGRVDVVTVRSKRDPIELHDLRGKRYVLNVTIHQRLNHKMVSLAILIASSKSLNVATESTWSENFFSENFHVIGAFENGWFNIET